MKEHYDRAIFFDAVRQDPFPGRLTQRQVDGMEAFLTYWESTAFTDRRWLAYCLGTQPIETAWTMQPVEELGRGRGRRYGERDPETGQIYYGRGLVQITWRENYERASKKLKALGLFDIDLVRAPELALQPDIAAAIMIYGMAEGWFTAHKLPDHFNDSKTDWVNARRIVNGTDRAHEIAAHAQAFKAALAKAATVAEPAQPTEPEPKPGEDSERDPVLAGLIERIKGRTGAARVLVEF